MLTKVPITEDEEDVSYDDESLFTNIPVKDTIDFICEEIYVHKKLEPICRKTIFKKLLYKLKTECTSSAAGNMDASRWRIYGLFSKMNFYHPNNKSNN